jgi:hypothetical protein
MTHEQLVRVRCAQLRELVADWEPARHVEIEQIVDALGRDFAHDRPERRASADV